MGHFSRQSCVPVSRKGRGSQLMLGGCRIPLGSIGTHLLLQVKEPPILVLWAGGGDGMCMDDMDDDDPLSPSSAFTISTLGAGGGGGGSSSNVSSLPHFTIRHLHLFLGEFSSPPSDSVTSSASELNVHAPLTLSNINRISSSSSGLHSISPAPQYSFSLSL